MRSLSEPTQRNPVPCRRPADLRAGRGGIARREPLEVDAAVDHRALRERLGHDLDEPVEQPGRHGDDRVRPPHGELRRRPDRAAAARVLDVLPVGGDDERGAAGEGGEQARRDEEVRVDDVGAEGVRRPQHVDGEPRVTVAASAAVDDGPRELVAARLERVLQRRDERAELRRVRPGVHLGDEQDPHAGSLGAGQAQATRPTAELRVPASAARGSIQATMRSIAKLATTITSPITSTIPRIMGGRSPVSPFSAPSVVSPRPGRRYTDST